MPYRFKESRLKAGLTKVQLAQKMGVTQAAVSHWDAGKKVPGTETLANWRTYMVLPLITFLAVLVILESRIHHLK